MDKELKETVSRLSNKEHSFYFACKSAMDYLRTKNSLQEAWDLCEDPFWMLWYISRCWGTWCGRNRQLFVRMNCDIASMSIKFIDSESDLGKKAIAHLDSAKAWAYHTEYIPTNPSVKSPSDLCVSATDLNNAPNAEVDKISISVLSSITSVANASYDRFHAAWATAQRVEQTYLSNKVPYRLEMLSIIRKHYPSPPSLNPITENDEGVSLPR